MECNSCFAVLKTVEEIRALLVPIRETFQALLTDKNTLAAAHAMEVKRRIEAEHRYAAYHSIEETLGKLDTAVLAAISKVRRHSRKPRNRKGQK